MKLINNLKMIIQEFSLKKNTELPSELATNLLLET